MMRRSTSAAPFSTAADGLITDSLKRDFTSRDGDVVAIVLDTFLDSRNAFTFLTNPGGALSDAPDS